MRYGLQPAQVQILLLPPDGLWCDPLKHLAPRKDGAIWRVAIAYIRVVTGACYQNSG